MTTHKITTTDNGSRRTFTIRPGTPLAQLLNVARADTRRADTPAVALDALADVRSLEMFLDLRTDELALAARRDGASWKQIGSALGLTRQRTHQRWGAISKFAGWDRADDIVDTLVKLAERPDLLTGPRKTACRCAGDDPCDHPQRLTAARARLSYYQERLVAEPDSQPLAAAVRTATSQIARLELELDR